MIHFHRQLLLSLPLFATIPHDLSHIDVLLLEEVDACDRLPLEGQGTRLARVSKFVDSCFWVVGETSQEVGLHKGWPFKLLPEIALDCTIRL